MGGHRRISVLTFRLAELLGLAALGFVITASAQERPVRPPAAARQDAGRKSKIAIVVGVGAYPEESQLKALKYTAKDAELVAEVLEKQGFVVLRYVDSSGGAHVIREALTDLKEALPPAGGTVLFFFSGHGVATEKTMYLATHDSTYRSIERSALAVDEVVDLLKQSGAERRSILLDACRVDMAPAGSRSIPTQVRRDFQYSEGARVLFATKTTMPSYEFDELGQGLFTYYLVKGLQGEAADAEGLITFRGLASYVTNEVRAWSTSKKKLQVPYDAGEATGDFLIAKVAPRLPVNPAAVEAPPALPSVSLADIRRLHDEERWAESVPMLTRLAAEQPNSPQIRALRSHAYTHLNQNDKAIEDGEAAVKLGPAVAEAYLRRGEALMSGGKLEQALKDCDRAIQLNPNEAEAYGNKGGGLLQLNQAAAALEALNRAIRLKADYAPFYFARASANFSLQKNQEALDDCANGLRIRPNSAIAYTIRGYVYVTMKRNAEGLQEFNQSLRLEPDVPDALFGRATAYMTLSKWDLAQADFNYLLRLKPDYPGVTPLLNRVNAELKGGSGAGNSPASPGIAPTSGNTQPFGFEKLVDDASAAIRQMRWTEAEAIANRLVQTDPARPEGWVFRGMIAHNAYGNLTVAIESYKQALQRSGAAVFRVAHDHGPNVPACTGILGVATTGVMFTADTSGHRFEVPYPAVQEAALNGFYGSALGMFHIKALENQRPFTANFYALRQGDTQFVERRMDAEMILTVLGSARRGGR